MSKPNIIVALDHATADEAVKVAERLDPQSCRLKVANTLFVNAGSSVVERLHGLGFELFLDLKFHDIPVQAAGACRAAADLGVWMLNVHASGGLDMMRASREALEPFTPRPYLIGVTVLTSLDAHDLSKIGFQASPSSQVTRLAKLTQEAGLDGIVCSAQELRLVRDLGPSFLKMTPGIRATSSAGNDDQKRVASAEQALADGASHLVIGRPITESADPAEALMRFVTG